MNKQELIEAAAQEAGLSIEHVALALECVLEIIVNRVAAGERVEIPTFGAFSTYEVPPEKAKTPDFTFILPQFKSSKAFERTVIQETRRRKDKALLKEVIQRGYLQE